VRHNLLHLLELPASCAPLWRDGTLSGDAQRRAARWLWRLLLAPHAAPAFLSLQVRVRVRVRVRVAPG
jgi:hypothetical protein